MNDQKAFYLARFAGFWLSAALVAFSVGSLQADDAPTMPPLEPPAPVAAPARPFIPLGEGDAAVEQWENFFGQLMVRNIDQAGIYPVLPEPGTGNGRAVIVVPGGGYRFVSMQNEGFPVAEALAARGYSAFVLKYHTFPTERDGQAFMDQMAALFSNLGKAKLEDLPSAVDDLEAAHAYIRAHAAEYAIDPARVGAIGFSAGARTAIRYVEQKGLATSLENVALIYPPMGSAAEGGVRPPLFLAIAVDDPLFAQGKLTFVESWMAESRAVEFHLYSGGGHGFGTLGKGTTSETWLASYLTWLDLN